MAPVFQTIPAELKWRYANNHRKNTPKNVKWPQHQFGKWDAEQDLSLEGRELHKENDQWRQFRLRGGVPSWKFPTKYFQLNIGTVISN